MPTMPPPWESRPRPSRIGTGRWRSWERSYTRDEWLDQLPTFGPFTRLPSDRLAEVLAGVGAAIDAMGGRFTVRYATVAVTAARTGAA
jgi:hypothetical protein